MCQSMIEFEVNKYVHLKDFLDKDSCAELVTELQRLVKENETIKDGQCPLSQSISGTPTFDSLLEQLTPHFEQASGKKLFPTYAYARLYSPGEELKIHTDRPSCEISATVTLGFEGSVWPIYMADHDETKNVEQRLGERDEPYWLKNISRIDMEVGDAVLYRGQEKVHWREKYTEGQWQAQVFLHYVDQNGPNAEYKYDKKLKLSHHIEPEYIYWHFSDAMTPEAAKKLIDSLEVQTHGEDAGVGSDVTGIVNKKIRDVKKINLPSYRGIGATMVGLGMAANYQAWKFDITHSHQTDYLKYDIDGHYHAHVDTFLKPNEPDCRKLTVLMFLNDDFEGGKLFLQNGHEKIYPPQGAGTCLVFPSFMLHGVEPVTKGVRRSIVTWLLGPWFK